jgi:hypothetical protein
MGSVCFPCLNANHGWIPARPSIYRGIQHRGGEKLSVGKFYPEDKEDGEIESLFGQLWWVPKSPTARVSQALLMACWVR